MKEYDNIDKTFQKWNNGRRNHIRVQETITQGEGISTPHIRFTQREPFSLIFDLNVI